MFVSNKNLANALSIILFVSAGYGQTTDSQKPVKTDDRGIYPSPLEDPRQRRLDEEKINPTLTLFTELHPEMKLKLVKKEELERLNGDISQFLVPKDYYTKFKNSLKSKKSGLARIYPEKNCFNGKTVSAKESGKCAEMPTIIGGGSFYSFRLKTNLNEKWSMASGVLTQAERADIHFVDGKISTGSDTVLGIISEINDIDFNSINSKSEPIRILKDYEAESKLSKFEEQKAALKKGIQLGKYNFSDSAFAKLNSTYLLRSIAYSVYSRAKQYNQTEIQFLMRIVDQLDIRTDVIIAFKIVGVEKDGSLIILWKELERKDPPVLHN